ncbi:MAG: PEP-CTERM sorting domain-containing protein, partial [Planctomycetota bacterium]|nr:PEP-CTERM sorting domain-containing protein [Planctomycetota bacterium]
NVFGLVSTFDGSNFTPIAYTGGSLTVSGVLNADGSTTATNDSALFGFMMDTDSSGFNEAYMMMISPTWHFTAIYSLEEVGHPTNQTAIRLRVTDLDGGPGHVPTPSDPLMDMPVDCTMQIETISSGPNAGNIRISAISYADYHGTGVEKISEMSFIVGVDTPSSSGHDPPGSYGPGDVPKIFGGATGFAGIVTVDVPTPLDTSIDDYTARDSLPGDFDLNGSVDVSDLGILATNYDTLTGATVFLGDGDFNGTVDVSDLGILATNYGQDVWTAAAAVPEPGTLMLLGLGTLTLLIRRNRR